MSKKNKAPDIQVRSGVLSCFNYKKKTLLQKEAYELSPMYWKCFRQGTSGTVIMQGHRSEMSNKGKPRVSMVVNGCTTELLPPILKSKGTDYAGNDNYLGIQAEDDKIVFLKAEGRSQRDLWYNDIIEALGDRASTTTNTMASIPEQRSPSQERPPMIPLEDTLDNDNLSLGGKASGQSDVYTVPYQDYEPMRCSVSTDDDGCSWTGTKPSPSITTKHNSPPIVSDVGEEDGLVSEQADLDEDGYVFPSVFAKKTIDADVVEDAPSNGSSLSLSKTSPLNVPRLPEAKPLLPEAKPLLPAAVDDRPAISSDFLESLKHAQESKPRPFDGSPEKPRYTAVTRRTKPPLPETPPKMPLAIPKELKQPTLETKSATEENVSPAKSPVKAVKTPEREPARKSRRKPLKMPPPLPAGGNSKPRSIIGNSSNERQESLPPLPPVPQARARPSPGEATSSSSETSPVKQHGAETNEKVYQLVRSFRSTQMSHDAKAVEIAKDVLLEKDALKLSTIKDIVYISGFRVEPSTSELLVGDEVFMINDQAVSSVEEATKCIQANEGETVTFSVKKIPHGVLSYISRPQEPTIDLKKLGLTLVGNEVTKFDSEGLVARSGIPSRQLVPGITNNGELVNWALTQMNMIPISVSVTSAQVEEILADCGNNVALVFHPADFAAAL
ncbi:uncharacterized protein LOC592175 [Strongylocentrotus purpuratus]|uniref:PH domain-containing protein n=2 Tax=Strongylocentrotus purpuratus TaxID=7668 RepID=A0A7M7P9D5_STRPU|nr:uncharacterized protein LOC592175 [Strongylocentrotus purpuratus]